MNGCSLTPRLPVVFALALSFVSTRSVPAMDSPPPAPPLPAIQSLELQPARLTLEDGRDIRRVLVWGKTAAGEKIDLSGLAKFEVSAPIVAQSPDGFVPMMKGETTVVVRAAGGSAKLPIRVAGAEQLPVRFVREVIPVMSRIGCNAGTCHGAAKGKNGFKLSLRGYDPEFDYQSLINDLSGRRFNRVAVEQSLMLLKPTAEVPHEGGQVIVPNSRDYQLLKAWIAEGTHFENPATARANRLEILPSEIYLALPGMSQHVIVLAHYPDGTERDVTRDAVLTSNNLDVAKVKDGVVTGYRRGEAAVQVRYEGNYATEEVTIMGDRSGYVWSGFKENNFIDRLAAQKWIKLKILPSELCSDAEFMRRVSLDLTGQPPKPERVRAFLSDPAPSREKREKYIDALLASPEHVDFWANKWADLLQCSRRNLGEKGVWAFRRWIAAELARNVPYDQFVRALILTRGSSYENPAVNYLRALREPGKMTEDISQTFLGTRFNCNKCHDHPFERWTQDQYYQFGAYFARVAMKRGSLPGEEIVYHSYQGGEVIHPKSGRVVAPKVPYGDAEAAAPNETRAQIFADWLTSKGNPLFGKSMANRVWSYFFGRGIIDPADDIRGSNPASNPALLDALTAYFVGHEFNVKDLMRVICQSRAYQLSFRANRWNQDDTVNFSHAIPRRLSAEQLMDAITVATGHRPQFNGVPAGFRAVDLPDGEVPGNDFLELFGRPKRQSACECERTSQLTLAHAMSLINGATIGDAVSAPGNRIEKIVRGNPDDAKAVEEIYLACLCRFPTAKELASIHLPRGESRLDAAQDLAWALLNSPAFLFNR